ncbi:hypothetical protein L2E82_09139 [Cichorium intybus]|uniref:Uncharacterized protein n=1 Tax=Cichorium intybus TaxID=13427 RepID=A0ACB9G876_CICIN|nr:hypothetical protein L2E82_09139 [Cichorium intybus]
MRIKYLETTMGEDIQMNLEINNDFGTDEAMFRVNHRPEIDTYIYVMKPENWHWVLNLDFIFIIKVFIMNLSAPFICEFFKDAQDKALPYVDYVFGNETVARMFSKVHGWNTDDMAEIAIEISRWTKASGTYKRITMITQGGKSCDAFFGRFLSQLVQKKPMMECMGVRGK